MEGITIENFDQSEREADIFIDEDNIVPSDFVYGKRRANKKKKQKYNGVHTFDEPFGPPAVDGGEGAAGRRNGTTGKGGVEDNGGTGGGGVRPKKKGVVGKSGAKRTNEFNVSETDGGGGQRIKDKLLLPDVPV